MCGQSVPMKSWAEDDKPREKLLQKGVAALSTNELLAILLRSGKVGESVLSISRRILADCGNELNNLARLSISAIIRQQQLFRSYYAIFLLHFWLFLRNNGYLRFFLLSVLFFFLMIYDLPSLQI